MTFESSGAEPEWSDVELRGLDEHTIEAVIEVVAPRIFKLVNMHGTPQRLHDMHLPREVVRHTVSVDRSTHELLEARGRMREGGEQTYVVACPGVPSENPIVGLAYRLPGQRLPRYQSDAPPAPTRLVPVTPSPVVDLARTDQVSAWIPLAYDPGMLKGAYRLLRTSSEGRAWALTPPPMPEDRRHIGNRYLSLIMDPAGYALEATGHFDDPMDSRGTEPPLSALYVARSEE